MITILLATYNGQAYLPEQLTSIFAQTVQDFRVLISDDGSTDNTLDIIRDFQERYPGQITLLPKRAGGHPGPMGNFAYLLSRCPLSDYTFFADQDDFWQPEKVALTLEKFQELEAAGGHSQPLLVHTAYQLADSQLCPLKESRLALTNRQKAAARQLGTLLQQNVVTGCTMAINRALGELLRPLPPEAIMHDWWLALLAAAFGRLGFVSVPTMSYRQHGNNNVGGNYRLSGRKLLGLSKKFHSQQQRQRQQAAAFLEQYRDILLPSQLELLQIYIALPEYCRFKGQLLLKKHHLEFAQPLKNLELFLLGY